MAVLRCSEVQQDACQYVAPVVSRICDDRVVRVCADQPGPDPALRSSLYKKSLSACSVVSRAISAMLEVSGIPLGHAFTQFAAFPQSLTPPESISAWSRSPAFIFPVGWLL